MRRCIFAMVGLVVVVAACSSTGSSGSEPSGETDASTEASGEATSDDTSRDDPSVGESTDGESIEGASTGDQSTDGASTGGESGVTASLDWQACDAGLECATLVVPLDHGNPDATIELAVARVPAAEPERRIGSLVINPGGPGGSGVDYLELAQIVIPADVAAVFDLVSFDPRGVGASSSVDCDLVIDDNITLVDDDDRAAWDAMLADDLAAYDTCRATVDGLEQRVGTNDAARDLDLLRAALGDDELTYLGYSYGTRLGATYAELFPDRVRALVLDGAVKPTDDLAAIDAEQAGGFDRAFDNFAAACDGDDDCLLRELGPTRDVVEAIRAEIAEVGSFTTDDPDRRLTPGELELGIISSLYSKDAWPFLAQAIYLAETTADGTLFQVLGDSLVDRRPDGSYGNLTEANRFINCADDPTRPGDDDVWARSDATADQSSSFGPALRASIGCLGIEPAVDPLVIGPAADAAPILVIGTTGDPATPYEWSAEMAAALDSAVLFTVVGEGHTAYTSIDCVSGVVGRYLIDLELPEPDSSCVDDASDDVFVPVGESEFEQVVAFFQCIVDEGAPIEPVTVADLLADPTGEEIFADLDPSDPEFQTAALACADLLPL